MVAKVQRLTIYNPLSLVIYDKKLVETLKGGQHSEFSDVCGGNFAKFKSSLDIPQRLETIHN
jgi:hypothetical protein